MLADASDASSHTHRHQQTSGQRNYKHSSPAAGRSGAEAVQDLQMCEMSCLNVARQPSSDVGEAPANKQCKALLLAVSRRGCRIDLLAWRCDAANGGGSPDSSASVLEARSGGDSGSTLVLDSSASLGNHASVRSVASSCSGAGAAVLAGLPVWLQTVSPDPPTDRQFAQHAASTTFWTPLCWLPVVRASDAEHGSAEHVSNQRGRVLVCGTSTGKLAAWSVAATPHLANKLAGASSGTHSGLAHEQAAVQHQTEASRGAAASASWRRSDVSDAQAEGSWQTQLALHVKRRSVLAEQVQPGMLFSLHANLSVDTAANFSGRQPVLNIWTTSISREVAVWSVQDEAASVEGTCAECASSLQKLHSWQCIGSPLTSMHVEQV